jgi:glutamyl-tRNA synthetase
MEDVDSPRTKSGADRQAIRDLQWLGLDWDEGPDVGGPHAPYVQTQRLAYYESLLEKLRKNELVYPCSCTRKDVQEAASAPHAEGGEPSYPGTCSHRIAAAARSLTPPYCWRFRTSTEAVAFVDEVVGAQLAAPSDFGGDFVVWKHDRTPAYQLAVVADDHAMAITEVVRGDDLIPSTFRQLCLYRAFGWSPPRFAHVPLVVGSDGRRLAKRHGDTRLETLRQAGVAPEALVGILAWSAGLAADATPVRPAELVGGFTFERVSKERLVLTPELLARIGFG